MTHFTPKTDKALWIKILLGMALGVGLGLVLSPSAGAFVNEDTALILGEWIALPGIIFLGLLKMVVIPLVICSIIIGVTDSGSMEFLKSMGVKLIPYFVITSFIAITIGVTLAQSINPAQYIDNSFIEEVTTATDAPYEIFDQLTIPQRIENMLPTNFTEASLEKNMLQIVIFAFFVGIIMLNLPKKTTKPFADLCEFGQSATMKVIEWAMILAPYAVFGLICNITIQIGIDTLTGVGAYMGSVILGLLSMMVVYLLIVSIISKRNIFEFLRGIRNAQILAFSTSSSAATMPFTLKAAEENLKIDEKISRFTIPLGATINMDGTALYQAAAALFLCSLFGVDLNGVETFLLMITIVGASIGTPATPGVGIIVLATILAGIGVPPEGIGIILGVDRILDMCRTTLNVTGDLVATTVMERFHK
ncbi:MAG: dicarboxylate/amino acid:cation symporter [Alphaproteobacteria bacterium]|nr:dicarboxylate/amino acid:cation symporter [Alphaproteobacteria bacterium]